MDEPHRDGLDLGACCIDEVMLWTVLCIWEREQCIYIVLVNNDDINDDAADHQIHHTAEA